MPSILTKSGIWNLALDTIREAPVQDQLTNSAPIKWLNRNYEHARDVLLRSYVWNFAIEFHDLNQVATSSTAWLGGWDYKFGLPNNWLRVLPFTEYGERRNRTISHKIAGGFLYANHSIARVSLVMRVENEGMFDPLFVEALAAKLALGMANKFTGKNKYIELAGNMLSNAVAKAEEIDTLEGSAEPLEHFDIIDVRA